MTKKNRPRNNKLKKKQAAEAAAAIVTAAATEPQVDHETLSPPIREDLEEPAPLSVTSIPRLRCDTSLARSPPVSLPGTPSSDSSSDTVDTEPSHGAIERESTAFDDDCYPVLPVLNGQGSAGGQKIPYAPLNIFNYIPKNAPPGTKPKPVWVKIQDYEDGVPFAQPVPYPPVSEDEEGNHRMLEVYRMTEQEKEIMWYMGDETIWHPLIGILNKLTVKDQIEIKKDAAADKKSKSKTKLKGKALGKSKVLEMIKSEKGEEVEKKSIQGEELGKNPVQDKEDEELIKWTEEELRDWCVHMRELRTYFFTERWAGNIEHALDIGREVMYNITRCPPWQGIATKHAQEAGQKVSTRFKTQAAEKKHLDRILNQADTWYFITENKKPDQSRKECMEGHNKKLQLLNEWEALDNDFWIVEKANEYQQWYTSTDEEMIANAEVRIRQLNLFIARLEGHQATWEDLYDHYPDNEKHLAPRRNPTAAKVIELCTELRSLHAKALYEEVERRIWEEKMVELAREALARREAEERRVAQRSPPIDVHKAGNHPSPYIPETTTKATVVAPILENDPFQDTTPAITPTSDIPTPSSEPSIPLDAFPKPPSSTVPFNPSMLVDPSATPFIIATPHIHQTSPYTTFETMLTTFKLHVYLLAHRPDLLPPTSTSPSPSTNQISVSFLLDLNTNMEEPVTEHHGIWLDFPQKWLQERIQAVAGWITLAREEMEGLIGNTHQERARLEREGQRGGEGRELSGAEEARRVLEVLRLVEEGRGGDKGEGEGGNVEEGEGELRKGNGKEMEDGDVDEVEALLDDVGGRLQGVTVQSRRENGAIIEEVQSDETEEEEAEAEVPNDWEDVAEQEE